MKTVINLLFLFLFFGESLQAQRPTMVPLQTGQAFQWQSGRTDFQMSWEGVDRHFIVYLPTQYQHTQLTPVVFMFHGTTGTGHKMYNISGWKEMADRAGFIVVFPTSWKYPIQGKGKQTKWHSGGLPYAVEPGTSLKDDVGFVKAMLTSLKASLKVDEKRIYASGFSNGGAFVSSKLLPEMSDVFAALSSGSGLFQELPIMQHPPIPVYQMLGSKEIKFAERMEADIPYPAAEWINHPNYGHMIQNALTALQLQEDYREERGKSHSTLIFDQTVNGGRGKYIFSLLKDLDHIYPNGRNNPYHFVAAKKYWEFFQKHPKP